MYLLLFTYPGMRDIHVATTGSGPAVATEENKHLLTSLGERMMTENLISSYQIVKAVGDVICRDSKTGEHVNCGPLSSHLPEGT